jgi:hypothetical protein
MGSSIDPLRATAVPYEARAPLADNLPREGRRKNRRIEILVYKESITSSSGKPRLDLERTTSSFQEKDLLIRHI